MVNEWIKISDRKPEPDEWVLFFDEDADAFGVGSRVIRLGKDFWCISGWDDAFDDVPTHWQSLPKRPATAVATAEILESPAK